jgi:MFS transporter, DHA3 family, macrolide efflux protein
MFVLAPLKRPPIALFWGSQMVTSIGEELYRVALIWLATAIAGHAAGWVAATQQISVLAISLVGGVLVDRWNSRKAMVAVDVTRAIALLLVPAMALMGPIDLWPLFIIAIVTNGLRGVYQPALQAAVPRLSSAVDMLLAVNALLDSTRRLARIIGPGVAGALALLMPVEHFFALISVLFVLSALAIFSLRRYMPPDRVEPAARGGVSGVVADFLAGMRLVRGNRMLAGIFLTMFGTNVMWTLAFTLGLPLLVREEFPVLVGVFGLAVAGYGMGNLTGNFIIGSLPYRPQILCLYPGRIVLGLGFMLMTVAPSVPLLMAAAALAAFGGTMGDLPFLALMQKETAPDQIGRVYGLRMTAEAAGGLIGAVAAVPLYGALPATTVAAGAGAATIVIGMIGLWLMRHDLAHAGREDVTTKS